MKGRARLSTEMSSETEVSNSPNAQDDHAHQHQEIANVDQHHSEVVRYDAPTRTGVVLVDERTSSLEIPATTSELRDYRGPVSIPDALGRRTNTYP